MPLIMRNIHYHVNFEIINIIGRAISNHLTPIKGTNQCKFSTLIMVTLTFYGRTSLELDPTSLFHQFKDDYLCLNVMMSLEIDYNIYGTTALHNYNIEFDYDDDTYHLFWKKLLYALLDWIVRTIHASYYIKLDRSIIIIWYVKKLTNKIST